MTIEAEILDPVLAVALDEIDEVLKKHKIAGAVAVASSTHAAFRVSFPEWSFVQIDPLTRQLRVRARKSDPKRTEDSLHMLLALTDLCGLHALQMRDVSARAVDALGRAGVVVEHEPFGGPEPEANT